MRHTVTKLDVPAIKGGVTEDTTCRRCNRAEASHAPGRRQLDDACDRYEAAFAPRISFEPFDRPQGRGQWDLYDPLQHSAWLVLPEETWTTAYRLIIRNREFEIAEVRIYPTDPPDFPYAADGEWMVDRDTVPRGGITSDLIRQAHLSKVRPHLREVLVRLRDEISPEEFDKVLGDRDLPTDIIARLRRKRDDSTKAERRQLEVAISYAREVRNGNSRPREAVRRDLHLSSSRVGNILRVCREKGFLTESPHGRAGGTLTERAITRAHELGLRTGAVDG